MEEKCILQRILKMFLHIFRHFLTSLQLEKSILEPEASRLPQDLLERCAAISARPNAIKDLVDVMGSMYFLITFLHSLSNNHYLIFLIQC